MAITKINVNNEEFGLGGGYIETTYAELKALRDSNQLVAGQMYVITDYQCTTTQENTQSAGHQFDIIVTADSNNTLSEIARARHHKGDTYFAESDLGAWELKYCLDNNPRRFYWADEENGKGVIYFMKDEHNNECPYDFKNIMYLREVEVVDGEIIFDEGNEQYVYTFTGIDLSDGLIQDATIITKQISIDDSTNLCLNNVIKEYYNLYSGTLSGQFILNENIFINWFSTEDEFYFHCSDNYLNINCHSNLFKSDARANILGVDCYFNLFEYECRHNILHNDVCECVFGTQNFYNEIFSNSRQIYFGNFSKFNIIGSNCWSITLLDDCENNTIGNNVEFLTINHAFYDGIIENGVRYVDIKLEKNGNEEKAIKNVKVSQGVAGFSYINMQTLYVRNDNILQQVFISSGKIEEEV